MPVPLPALASQNSSLSGVSCATARFWVAVGGYEYGSGCTNYYGLGPCNQQTIIEQWNGRHWQELPGPAGAGGLSAVSCSSSRSCIAVGGSGCYGSGGGSFCSGSGFAPAEHWDGRRWSLQATPTVSVGMPPQLVGVSCGSLFACTAVGTYAQQQSQTPAPLAEGWNGTSWAVEPTPADPSAGQSTLASVSCTSPRACTAVGGLPNPGTTLVQRWDGATWTVQPSPNPPNTETNVLNSVSCTSAVRCIAVGISTYPDIASLAEAWNGTRWRIQRTP